MKVTVLKCKSCDGLGKWIALPVKTLNGKRVIDVVCSSCKRLVYRSIRP